MKKLLYVLIFSVGSMSFDQKKEINHYEYKLLNFCDGWDDGYCEGWRDVKGQFTICPVTPVCPVPKLNCMEGFKCGYNRGFKYGLCKAMKRSNCKK